MGRNIVIITVFLVILFTGVFIVFKTSKKPDQSSPVHQETTNGSEEPSNKPEPSTNNEKDIEQEGKKTAENTYTFKPYTYTPDKSLIKALEINNMRLGYKTKYGKRAVKVNGEKIALIYKDAPEMLYDYVWKDISALYELKIPEDVLRASLCYAFGILKVKKALPKLHKLLKSKTDEPFILALTYAIGEINSPESIVPLFERMIKTKDRYKHYFNSAIRNKFFKSEYEKHIKEGIKQFKLKRTQEKWLNDFNRIAGKDSPLPGFEAIKPLYQKKDRLSELEITGIIKNARKCQTRDYPVHELIEYLIIKWNDDQLLKILNDYVFNDNNHKYSVGPVIKLFHRLETNWGNDIYDLEKILQRGIDLKTYSMREIPLDYLTLFIDELIRIKARGKFKHNVHDNLLTYLVKARKFKIKDDKFLEGIEYILKDAERQTSISPCLLYLKDFYPKEGFPYFKEYIKHPEMKIAVIASDGLFAIKSKEAHEIVKNHLINHPIQFSKYPIANKIIKNKLPGFEKAVYAAYKQYPRLGELEGLFPYIASNFPKEEIEQLLSDKIRKEDDSYIYLKLYGKALFTIKSDKIVTLFSDKLDSRNKDILLVTLSILADTKDKEAVPEVDKFFNYTRISNWDVKTAALISLVRLGEVQRAEKLMNNLNNYKSFYMPFLIDLLYLDWKFIEKFLENTNFTNEYYVFHPDYKEKAISILTARNTELQEQITAYLDKNVTRKPYRLSTELLIQSLLNSKPSDASLEVLKKYYWAFTMLNKEDVKKYSFLRKDIAVYLTKHTNNKYKNAAFISMDRILNPELYNR